MYVRKVSEAASKLAFSAAQARHEPGVSLVAPGLGLEARPPFLAPRQAEHALAEVAQFIGWLRHELGLSADAQVDVAEYIAFDTRVTPHTTRVSVSSRSGQIALWIGKALGEIRAEDLPICGPDRGRTGPVHGEAAAAGSSAREVSWP